MGVCILFWQVPGLVAIFTYVIKKTTFVHGTPYILNRCFLLCQFDMCIFGSPVPKGEVNYCNHMVPVIVHYLLHFDLFTQITGPFETKFGNNMTLLVLDI